MLADRICEKFNDAPRTVRGKSSITIAMEVHALALAELPLIFQVASYLT
jgi:hypothetical protein